MLAIAPDAADLCVFIACCVYWCLGLLLASALPAFEAAQAMSGLLSPLFFLFSGMWAPRSQIVPGASWCASIDGGCSSGSLQRLGALSPCPHHCLSCLSLLPSFVSLALPVHCRFCVIDPLSYLFGSIESVHFYCNGPNCPTISLYSTTGNGTTTEVRATVASHTETCYGAIVRYSVISLHLSVLAAILCRACTATCPRSTSTRTRTDGTRCVLEIVVPLLDAATASLSSSGSESTLQC